LSGLKLHPSNLVYLQSHGPKTDIIPVDFGWMM